MKAKVIDVLRFSLISQEVFFGFLTYIALQYFDKFTIFIAGLLIPEDIDLSSLSVLFGMPATLFVASIKIGYDVLKPHNALKGWKEYWMLKYRVVFCFIVCFISLIGSFISWYYASQISRLDGISILLSLWVISFTSVLSLGWANIQLRELLHKY